MNDHEHFMRQALSEADRAASELEVPVGAVIVLKGRVIGRGANRTIGACDPTAHAEIVAIGAACQAIGNYRLEGATLYVTLEPCPMCMGAILWARVKTLVFGAADPKAGACGSVLDLSDVAKLNHKVRVVRGILEEESAERLKAFFKRLRARPS